MVEEFTTAGGFAEALRELGGIKHVHPVGPTVVGVLDERVLVVAVGIIDRLRARQGAPLTRLVV